MGRLILPGSLTETLCDLGCHYRSGTPGADAPAVGVHAPGVWDGCTGSVRPLGGNVPGGARTWEGGTESGRGDFQHAFCGGPGIVYAVTFDGRLLWYRQVGYANGAKRPQVAGTAGPGASPRLHSAAPAARPTARGDCSCSASSTGPPARGGPQSGPQLLQRCRILHRFQLPLRLELCREPASRSCPLCLLLRRPRGLNSKLSRHQNCGERPGYRRNLRGGSGGSRCGGPGADAATQSRDTCPVSTTKRPVSGSPLRSPA